SARALGLHPTLTAQDIEALAHHGLKKFQPGTDVYIRPMYWAEEGDATTVGVIAESTDFVLCLEAIPMVEPRGFTITTTSFRLPYLAVMPVNPNAACLYPTTARMLREARAKGFDNAIVTDVLRNGAETATSNISMVRCREVFTP